MSKVELQQINSKETGRKSCKEAKEDLKALSYILIPGL